MSFNFQKSAKCVQAAVWGRRNTVPEKLRFWKRIEHEKLSKQSQNWEKIEQKKQKQNKT